MDLQWFVYVFQKKDTKMERGTKWNREQGVIVKSIWQGTMDMEGGREVMGGGKKIQHGAGLAYACIKILFLEDLGVLKRTQVVVRRQTSSLLGLLGLLGQKHSLDVWQHTSLGDGHTGQKLVQLLVITDGQLKMTGDDPCLLVVTGSISCQLKDLSSKVLHDGSQVNGSASTNPLGIVTLAE